jgi:LuxR family maltose regulon positive regulatory protein
LCYAIQARIQMAGRKVEQAQATIAQARRLVEERTLPSRYANEVNTLEVKFWLSQGEIDQAQEWVANNALRPTDGELLGKVGQYRLLARVLVAQRQWEIALELLHRLHASAQETGKMLSLLETLALTSVVEILMGRESAALATLQQALSLAEPQGYIRTFLDEGPQMGRLLRLLTREYRQERSELLQASQTLQTSQISQTAQNIGLAAYVARLLAAWQSSEEPEPQVELDRRSVSSKATPSSILVEPLSERELEVLLLVAEGLSDRQIADRLIIVPGTVKRHLNSVYGKLGVHSRTQAIARARQLSLIKNAR